MCFAAGTLISTENGLIPIEDIKIGDYVYTINELTNTKELKPVSNTIISKTDTMYKITVDDDIIYASPKHPFYVVDKGYIRAYDLKIGDLLLSNSISYEITDIEIIKYDEPIEVYNLTIDDNHNFLITDNEYLVHNAIGSPTGTVTVN